MVSPRRWSKEAKEEVVCIRRTVIDDVPKLTHFQRSKGKVKDKAQHAVVLDKTTSEKLYKDVQSYRLVTIATLVDRMKINGSLARQCLADLEEKGIIKPVVTHSKMKIYSMASPLFSHEHSGPPMRYIRSTANVTLARAVGGSD
ncbi:S25 ribosomal protein-domain-containing protein [Fusarium redolens]|uniref:40S ribosomal protein S25 n=1 Tax=Fusarium redolens TaxID=48865 RepID=A0A9P9H482_FUSRE|nr:S25 ribosomal protein-domain-containing protein [Fusarium redolens]KAH7250085.1 S25 ribosomal protein-domain-containing protein [Fusarium redolens]